MAFQKPVALVVPHHSPLSLPSHASPYLILFSPVSLSLFITFSLPSWEDPLLHSDTSLVTRPLLLFEQKDTYLTIKANVHIEEKMCNIYLSVSGLSHSGWLFQPPSIYLKIS